MNVIIESLHLRHFIGLDLCSLYHILPFICKCQRNALYSLYNEKGDQPQEITTPVFYLKKLNSQIKYVHSKI